MDGEQAHHIAVVVDLRLLLAGGVAGLGGPGEELAEAASAGGGERSRPLDELLDVGDRLHPARTGGGQELDGVHAAHELAHELVRLERAAPLVQLAQNSHGRENGFVPRGLPRGEQIEPAVRTAAFAVADPEAHEVVVGEAEVAGVQGAVERRAVAGVVDGAQAEEGVGHLVTIEVRLAALDAVRHSRRTERLFVGL